MKNNALDMINKETSRLLGVQSDTLKEAININYLFTKYTEGADITEEKFTVPMIESWIGILKNESQKLNKLEMVLAVIGTMKAGKSTTINAIVGMEILPNRETAMTTLPTLIRNVHGQTQPVLTINKVQPLHSLCKDIAKKLQGMKEPTLNQINLHGIADGKTLIHQLIKNGGYPFATRYEGSEAIFEFLKQLNDVMRLAKDESIAIEPPYHDYENVEDLPVIEVEFCHLSGNESLAQGSLAILDTPGPNEFGQSEALRRVFEKQMEKASAILLVTDFTQMNTKADEEVRSELDKIKNHLSKDRLAVVVNKFDQATKNSMSKEAVKEYVASNLLAKKIEPSRIFPVSSYRAYLSNRAKTALLHNGKLPDPEQEPWVADFASLAFGPLWNEMPDTIDNIDKVNANIEALWKLSLFEAPIDKVIKEAHATAATKSWKSAFDKLSYYNREMSNKLNISSNLMGECIEGIEQKQKIFQQDIEKCSQVRIEVEQRVTNCWQDLEGALDTLKDAQLDAINETIARYFRDGKKMQSSEIAKIKQREIEGQAKNNRKLGPQFLSWLLEDEYVQQRDARINEIVNEKIEQLFDPKSPIIKFQKRSDADNLTRKVTNDVASIFKQADQDLNASANQLIQKTTQNISELIDSTVADTLNKAQNELGGIEVSFSLPKIDLAIEEIDSADLFDAGYQEKTEDITRTRKGKGLGARFLNWLNDDWGREEYEVKETAYYVDLKAIEEQVNAYCENMVGEVKNQTSNYLKNKFEPKIDEHLTELVNYLKRYHNELGKAIESNLLEQNSQAELLNSINGLLKTQRVIYDDLNAVKHAQETKGGQQ